MLSCVGELPEARPPKPLVSRENALENPSLQGGGEAIPSRGSCQNLLSLRPDGSCSGASPQWRSSITRSMP